MRLAIILCITVVTSCWQTDARAQDFANLWTRNRRIHIARFHVLLLDAISPDELSAGRVANRLREVLTALNNDVDELAQGSVPSPNFRIERMELRLANSRAAVERSLDELRRKLADGTGDDVFFVYVLAHGRLERGQTILQFGSEGLPRQALLQPLEALTQSSARLGIVVTDNCNEGQIASSAVLPDSSQGALIWRALYFGLNGFVDVQSSDPRAAQSGFMVNGEPIFLKAFRDAITLSRDEVAAAGSKDAAASQLLRNLDTNRDSVVRWSEFESRLRQKTNIVYRAHRDVLRTSTDPVAQELVAQGGQDIVLTDEASVNDPR